MAENLNEEAEVNFDDIVTDDCMEDDLITVSRHRYGRIYRERDKYLKQGKIMLILFLSILALLAIYSALLTIVTTHFITENSDLNEKYKQQITDLTEQVKVQCTDLEEKNNEVLQLRDRIGFLALAGAMYEEEHNEESEVVSAEEFMTKDWRSYVNLFTIGQKVPLPEDIDTNTFRCMDYRTITDTTSWQYKIQTISQTDYNSGLRYYTYNGEKYYTVALATAYGIDIGNAYRVTLENGTVFNIIHAEYKHDIRYPRPDDFGDPDKNYDKEDTISVIEFVYDDVNAPAQLIADGEANRWLGEGCDIYGDGCNIKEMIYLGKVWTVS